jgi:uncharacterized membrane protein SpoIIM required for sporulation
MNLDTFLLQRRPDWKKLEALQEQVENSGLGSLDDAQAVEYGRLYRRAASDLNQAQTFVSGDATVRALNSLVARCYLVIHKKRRLHLRAFLRQMIVGYPAVFRRCLGHLGLATLILLAGTAFGFLASWLDAPLAREMLLPDMPMIQPGQEGGLMPSGHLAGFSSMLFANNTKVALLTCALGFTWGIGTCLILWQNGLILGALAAVFWEADDLVGFATGVLPHGVLEIPAVLIGGGAGFVIAQAMLRARPWPRAEEMAHAGRLALWLVAGCFPLLTAAAILEAGVARAPEWFLDRGIKLGIAAVVGAAFFAYLILGGWGKTGTTLAQVGEAGADAA